MSRRRLLRPSVPDVPTWKPEQGHGLRLRPAPGHLPPGLRVYALGDVRGDLTALRAAYHAIASDLASRPARHAVVVHLGNLIGSGPDSAGVLEALSQAPAGLVLLRGDIEEMLLAALNGDRPAATDFLHAGGRAALRSWGVSPDAPRLSWAAQIPGRHLALLQDAKLVWRCGEYVFVHAGIRPGVPLARQARQDLLTIRQPFLSSEREFGVVVVHGHNATPRPELRQNRLGLDTGAGIGGYLTCLVLEEDSLALLS